MLLQKSARHLAILHQIKKVGASIVLDDFGTGYSSLGYLRLFPEINRPVVSARAA